MIDLEKYSVRQGTREDADLVVLLINRVQPNDLWTREYFMWQYFGLSIGSTYLYLIFHNQDLVALYAAVGKQCNILGEVRDSLMIQDVMTHPEHRGQGFLNYLTTLCIKTIKSNGLYAYTFPNKLSENSFRRSGWSELGIVPLREKMVILDSVKSNIKIDRVEEFDQRVEKIWGNSGLYIGVNRDRSFLNWRYSRPNTFYFKFLIQDKNGYLVLKLFENQNVRILHILDFVLVSSAVDSILATLQFVSEFASSNNVKKITCWLAKEHPYAKFFDEVGLNLVSEHDRFSFVMAPEKDLEAFSRLSHWHLTQGDSDIY